MRRYLMPILFALPCAAAGQTTTEDGIGLVERGLGVIAENLWNEFGPELNRLGLDMAGIPSGLAPLFEDLAVLVDDPGNYQAPERLSNGDVLIRRKPGAPPPPPMGASGHDGDDPAARGPLIPIDPDQPEIPL